MGYRCLVWNVRGVNNYVKRKRILNYLKQYNVDIAMFQETHLTDKEHLKLKQGGYNHIFFSSFTSKARGVILLHKSLTFQENSVRFVIVQGLLNSDPITLVNVYGPNIDNPQFFERLFFALSDSHAEIYMGGDFNLVLDTDLDRSSQKTCSLTRSAIFLKEELLRMGLVDIWHALNKNIREHSFYSPVHDSYTRIDLFLLPSCRVHQVTSCEYLARSLSDHAALLVIIPASTQGARCNRWRFTSHLLNDSEFVIMINREISSFLDINQNTANPNIVWDTMKAYLRGQTIAYASSKCKKYKGKNPIPGKEDKGFRKTACSDAG